MLFTAVSDLWDVLCIPSIRVAISFSTFVSYALPPLLSYFVFAVLAIIPKTRALRVALWPIIALLALRGAMSLDISLGKPDWARAFLEVELVLCMVTIASRTLHWTMAREPLVRHTRPKNATLSTAMDTLDLAFNLRGYGWNWSRGLYIPIETRPSDRTAFLVHAIFSAMTHAFVCGTLHVTVKSFSPTGIGSLTGGSILDDELPFFVGYLRATIIATVGAFAIYNSLQMGYNLCIIPGILVFGQDPAQWPLAFDAPWRATSLVDFWGRRWHQWFRHTFLFVGGYPLSLILGRVGIVLGSFLASAVFHHIALITLNGQVELWRMLLSFGMMAFGVLVERTFEGVMRKRVDGRVGRVWTVCWLGLWGSLMIDGWARAGMYGSSTLIDWMTPVRALIERSVTNFDAWLHML